MDLSGELFMRSGKGYFGIYFPSCDRIFVFTKTWISNKNSLKYVPMVWFTKRQR